MGEYNGKTGKKQVDCIKIMCCQHIGQRNKCAGGIWILGRIYEILFADRNKDVQRNSNVFVFLYLRENECRQRGGSYYVKK